VLPRIPGPPAARRGVSVAVVLSLVALGGVAASSGSRPAAADTPLAGAPVPTDQVQVIAQAVLSCPALTAPRLAGQLMAASGFDANAVTDTGGSGVAGLSDAQWQQWIPWPDAQRQDVAANVTALARHMCDLVGQIRHADIGGELWDLALAAHVSGFAAIEAAKAVPAQAIGYVTRVNRYTAWYAQQPDFDTGTPTPSAAPAQVAPLAGNAPRAIPDPYLDLVLAAGKICPAIGPAQIAGQLMAASAFNPSLLGSGGAQGIAQFLPTVWSRYGTAEQSPWDPAAAIPTLGRAMCSLTGELAGLTDNPYPVALAAYQWGPATVAQAGGAPDAPSVKEFADRVLAYSAYYAQDPRLGGRNSASPSSTPGKADPPVQAAPPANRPPAAGGSGSGTGTGSGGTKAGTATKASPKAAATTKAAASIPKYEIYGYAGKCVYAPSTADGQQLAITTCTGAAKQMWQFYSDGTIRQGGLCMDLAWASSDNGTKVQLAKCNGGWAQKFIVNKAHDLVNTVIGKCVDVKDWNDANGAVLQLWTCNGQSNQKWYKRS
jgi:hypothetical protein